MLCYVMLCYVMLCYVMLCFTLINIMLCYVISEWVHVVRHALIIAAYVLIVSV